MRNSFFLDLAPLLSLQTLYALAGLVFVLILLSLFLYRRGLWARMACAAAFMLLFLNPSFVEEQRTPVSDVVLLMADRSPSQSNGERTQRTNEAMASFAEMLKSHDNLDVRMIDGGEDAGPSIPRETHMFDKIDRAMADIPPSRRAGVILVTDGQVHDVPQDPARFDDYGPVHVFLTGEKAERDRQLVILEAPSYGIVGQPVTIRYRIEDSQPGADTKATISVRQDNAPSYHETVAVNEDQVLTLTIDHAGQNILDVEVPAIPGEITQANNRVPLIVNGVRDRLRVLLVSGQPHAGGRTWRNLLSSDPGVDLIHFTILRDPEKIDITPPEEMSLIAFPFEELFEVKLYDFDLIIFDRYRLNRILPNYYFTNIARYVKEGGALLEASGPHFETDESIYETELSQVLPAAPTGQVYDEAFKPALTKTGRRHPVTQNLEWPGGTDENPGWGSWLRQVGITPMSGEILMTGLRDMPLLVLDHVGKGRVAQIASDQIWLWSRGFEGGGPQAELLRRLAHWLMKEPELEENILSLESDGGTLIIRRRSLTDEPITVSITSPDGKLSRLELHAADDGFLTGRFNSDQLGVHVVNDGTQERFALIGAMNAPELSGVITTEEKLKPLVSQSGGRFVWLSEGRLPVLRFLSPAAGNYGGRGWVGLRENRSYDITGVRNHPFLPEWAYALILLCLAIGCWWLEGRNKKAPRT